MGQSSNLALREDRPYKVHLAVKAQILLMRKGRDESEVE